MDRRHVLKASMASAAAIGISAGSTIMPNLNAQSAATPQPVASEPPLPSLYDYEAAAKRRLSIPAWEYFKRWLRRLKSPLRRNRSALDALQLKPRVLIDTTHIDTTCNLLGYKLEHPILLAPTSSHLLAHPDAEVATARGAALAKAILIASTNSNRSIEDICNAATGPVWFQLYVEDERPTVRALIERAEAAGTKALVITVDKPFPFARNREDRVKAQAPTLPFANLGMEAGPGGRGRPKRRFNWSELEWIQSFAKTPVILKGIINPPGRRRRTRGGLLAVKHNVAAIIVSNHGGRVLDTAPATIEVLPAVVDRVAGRVPVLFDSGIRRGTDVLKGLACGATAVLTGRPYIYGLAVAGPEGIADVVNILRTEFEGAMGLTGCTRLADINRSVLWKSRDYSS